MKKKKTNKKLNTKIIIIVSLIILVLGVSSGVGIYLYNKNQESKQEEPIIKKSPYTLEEIYELIGDYDKFMKELQDTYSDGENSLSYTICHFYDYFSKETPFPSVTAYFDIDTKKYIKIKEIEYINYYEYMEKMEWVYEVEAKKENFCEENKDAPALKECDFNCYLFAEVTVYMHENIKGEKVQ